MVTPAIGVPSDEPANGELEQAPAPRTSFDRAAGTFLACLNHEIRTPLSGVLGMVDLLLETKLDDEQRDYVGAARMCAESLFEILNAALEFSALEAGQFVLDENEFGVREMLDSALALHQPKAAAKNLKLFVAVERGLPETMVGDAPRLRELLGLLLANAVKFTPVGSVELRAGVKKRDESQDWLAVEVRDTGVGIAPERLGEIFESFRQGESGLSRTYPGLGLGLAVAKKLATLMGGIIRAESQIGAGSVFTVEIPLGRPVEPVPEAVEAPFEGSASAPWILAVDDNPVGLKVLRHLLERRKLNVDCANSGKEALQAASIRRYDLVLMDLQMPEMDGLAATTELRKIQDYDSVPVLALTANLSDHLREQCRIHGMQEFISKPVEADELLRTISRYVRRDTR